MKNESIKKERIRIGVLEKMENSGLKVGIYEAQRSGPSESPKQKLTADEISECDQKAKEVYGRVMEFYKDLAFQFNGNSNAVSPDIIYHLAEELIKSLD